MMKHRPRFTRDPSDSSYVARCPCGWAARAGDLTEIQLLADGHLPPPPSIVSPSIVPGFVSGLSGVSK